MTILRSGSQWLMAALLATGLLLASCQPPKQVPPPEKPKPNLLERAATAQEQGKFDLASELYWQALQEKDLGRDLRLQTWQALGRSALKSGKPELVRESLKRWRILDPDSVQTWAWQEIRSDLIRREQGVAASASHLRDLLDPDRPWSLVLSAGKALAELHLSRNAPRKALDTLKRLDELAKKPDRRDEVMEFAQGFISGMSPETRAELLETAKPRAAARFPALFLRWEQTQNRFHQEKTSWKEAWRELAGILEDAEAFIRSWLVEELRKLEEKHGRPAPGVVLLLPLDGGYGDLGWKIVRGVDIAQWRLSKQGRSVRLRVINTQDAGWLERLDRLSATYSLVGGPIRESSWQKIYRAELYKDLAFFTFRSGLQQGTEGEDAYRFFPGRKDQVRALLQMARENLDLSSFGVLYPESDFGRSMARSFWNATVQEDCEFNALDYYSPQQIVSYEDKVADYLHVPEEYQEWEKQGKAARNATNATQNATRIPKPDFEAVFIPDSFSRARILIPQFFYFNQPDLVFLGPALWGQEIKRISGLDTRYFNLTLLASPWWQKNPAREMKVLRHALEQTVQEPPDFWVGLGYDFLRFAVKLAPEAMVSENPDLASRLSHASDLQWTLAPLSWDEQGRARQDLFVLRPVADGVDRVRPEKLRDRLEKAREMKREWRERTWGNATANATVGEPNGTSYFGESGSEGDRNATFPEEGGGYDHQ